MATPANDSENLTPRQRRAIACLILNPTIQEAAKAAGIGERTLHTWLKLPAFQAVLAREEGMLISSAARRLVAPDIHSHVFAGSQDDIAALMDELVTPIPGQHAEC